MKVSAHNTDWCSVTVLVGGHSDAQKHFLRWLRKSRFSYLEATGAVLGELKKANVVKPRAPIGTLVLIANLSEIARTYNVREPKHKIGDAIDDIIWKDTIIWDDPPPIKGAPLEPALKRSKPTLTDDEDPFSLESLFADGDMNCDFDTVPCFALANTSTWIAQSPTVQVSLNGGFQVQKVIQSPEATFVLLPAMPPGIATLLINGVPHPIRVVSERTTRLLLDELAQDQSDPL